MKSNISKAIFYCFDYILRGVFPDCSKHDVVYESFINNTAFVRVGNAGFVAKCIAILASETEWLSSAIMSLGCL